MDKKNIYSIIEKKVGGPKRKASLISQMSHLDRSESAPPFIFLPKEEVKTSRPYLTWTRDMDNALGVVLMDQLAQGNKCDGDGWKSQSLQVAMEHLNKSLGLNLTKENIKNRLRAWKKYYGIVRDIQFEKSGFHWDEERKMIVITPAELPAWNAYVKGNPKAKFMANKEIHNWDDIVMLCGRDRVTGEGVEMFDEAAEAMAYEGFDEELSTHSVQSRNGMGRQSTSSATKVQETTKKTKKDALTTTVQEVAFSVKQYFENKKNNEDNRPSAKVIHEVVSRVRGLTRNEVFKATQRLMNGSVQEFELLQELRDDEKEDWIKFLLNN